MIDSRPYRVLKVLTNLLYLNCLWLLACLPVVTIPAATAAMFGVVREWVEGNEPPVARTYVAKLREKAVQSSVLGLVWTLLGAVLAADFLLVRQMGSVRYPLYALLCVLMLLYVFGSVYLFPVLAKYDTGWASVLKNAVLYASVRPFTTLASLSIVAVAVAGVVVLPVALCLAGSSTAYCVYRLCARVFGQVLAAKGVAGAVES